MPSLPGAHHRPDVFQKLDDVLKEHFRGLSVEKERELGILQEKFLSFSEKNASLKKEIEENIALGKEMTEHVVGVEARLKESQDKVRAVEEVLSNLEKSEADQNQKNVSLESKNQELSAAISKGIQTLDKQFTDNEKFKRAVDNTKFTDLKPSQLTGREWLEIFGTRCSKADK